MERVANDLGNLRKLNPSQSWGQVGALVTYSGVPQRLGYRQHPKPLETGVKGMLRLEGLAELCVRKSCGSNLLPASGCCVIVLLHPWKARGLFSGESRAGSVCSQGGQSPTPARRWGDCVHAGCWGPNSYPHSELSNSSLVPILTMSQDGGSYCSLSLPLNHNQNSWERIQKSNYLRILEKNTHTKTGKLGKSTLDKRQGQWLSVFYLFVIFAFAPQVSQIRTLCSMLSKEILREKTAFLAKRQGEGSLWAEEHREIALSHPTHTLLSLTALPQGHSCRALWWCRKLKLRESHIFGQRNHTKGSTGAKECEGNLNEERAKCLYQGHIERIRDYNVLDIDILLRPAWLGSGSEIRG